MSGHVTHQARAALAAASERHLVALAKSGDPDAREELCRRTYDKVFRYIRSRVPNRHAAEDLCQDTYLRALAGLRRYTWTGGPLIVWLYAIARRLIWDSNCLTRRQNREVANLWLVMQTLTDMALREPGIEEIVADRVSRVAAVRVIRTAMCTLPPAHRQVLRLRFLDGRTVAETAAVVRRRPAATKSLQYRAVRGLATYLQAGV